MMNQPNLFAGRKLVSTMLLRVREGNKMNILWAGEGKSLTAAASGGKLVGARYKITEDYVFVSSGLLTSSEEQIPMWAIRDCDIKQSMVQKARGVSNVILICEHNDFTGRKQIVLENVEDARDIRDIVNRESKRARVEYESQQKTQTVNYSGNPMQAPMQQGGVQQQEDPYEKLSKLGGLLEKGLITQEEFDAQKRQILGG